MASPPGRDKGRTVTPGMVLNHVMRSTGASVRLSETGDLVSSQHGNAAEYRYLIADRSTEPPHLGGAIPG